MRLPWADGGAKTREVKVGVVGTYRRFDRKGRPVRDPGCESHIVSPKTASRFGSARAVLGRHGGASLLKHLRKRSEALPPDHPSWKELDYFEKRKSNMRYGEYRKQGLVIGSGVVEAAYRTDVVRRCKQSGMHGRFLNAAAICALSAHFRSRLPAA